MRVETIVCDKCGKPVVGDPFSVQITAGEAQKDSLYAEPDGKKDSMYAELGGREFCEKCAGRVFAMLMGKDKKTEKAREANGDSATASQKKETSKRQKKLDKGKMMALKNAGWSNQQIAEELGTTEACIATYISQIRRKQVQNNG